MTARTLPPLVDHALGLGAVLVAWQVYVVAAQVPAYLLPAPAAVGDAIANLAASGALWLHLAHTLGNIAAGLALGTALGLAAGAALARSVRLERWLEGPILILQTAPKIALAPLFVIWFGLGAASKVALIVSLTAFPVLVATLVGLRGLDPALRDLARILDLSPAQKLWRIDLPAALPDIFVGFRIAAVQAVVGAVLGEWMSGKFGLGYLMTFASATYRTPLLFAAVALTVMLGLALHLALAAAERRLIRWSGAS
ncbi:MAG: ABC transporter permease [Telmatospirillum sp.]|nr:ABC transporter permease [Telmatospirillum sp.]